jgi:hypothetical protein
VPGGGPAGSLTGARRTGIGASSMWELGGSDMRMWLVGGVVVSGWLLLRRTCCGIRVGNWARAWSDRAMLAFLRLSSEF